MEIPKKVWNSLIEVANEDGIISNDEKILLDNIKKNLEIYYRELDNADENQLKVLGAQLSIMHDAYSTALMDGNVSSDEFELLKKLQIIVRGMLEEKD